MKRLSRVVLAAVCFAFVSVASMAQDELTDQDYKDYAVILLAQKAITDKISPMVNDLIARQEGMTGQRFQELRSKQGEPAKDWEKQFLNLVNKEIKEKQQAATSVVTTLAKHSLGASKYNAVKKAYAQGGDAKAKVDAFMADLVEKP
ncbi:MULTISPECIES: hypothetical protein [Roseivirga]|jgi:hypothetical protein|nr:MULTISPECIES: hypothetical protein [Roseivirga]MEC7755376.1 hypothetical protein [Bacteroidota bacterium]|tara:strand:- start:1443 stop:1883 length:441 start_codon:yes stop_codon:yes gene_type:complete